MVYIAGKLAIAVVALLATWLIWRSQWTPRWSLGRLAAVAFVARVAALLFLYLAIAKELPRDMPGFYDHASRVVHGQVPNRDFDTPYGFLFTYVLAIPVLLVNHPLSIIVMFQAAELFGVYLIFAAFRGSVDDGMLRRLCVLYLINPLVLITIFLGGQDESLLILLAGLVLYLVRTRGPLSIAAAVALGFFGTKLFAVWSLGPLLLRRRARDWAASAVACGLVVAGAVAAGSRVFSFRFGRSETADELAGFVSRGNIWSVLAQTGSRVAETPLPAAVTLAGLAGAGLLLLRVRRHMDDRWFVLYGLSLLTITFQALYRMTFAAYAAVAVAPLLILAANGRSAGSRVVPAVALWTTILGVQSTLDQFTHAPGRAGVVAGVLFTIDQVAIVVGTLAVFAGVVAYGLGVIRGGVTVPSTTETSAESSAATAAATAG